MLTIFGAFRSRATRPIWYLYEAGVEFRQVPVVQAYRLADPAAPDAPLNTASAEFLTVNPQGQVPAMEDDGLVLTESHAITLYLARKYGGDLAPKTVAEEGEVMQWSFLGATGVEDTALQIGGTYAKGLQDTPEGQTKIEAARAALVRPFTRIDAHLRKSGDWLVSGRFTVADLLLAECVRYAQPHPGVYDRWPALKLWLERCQARPAFQRMWTDRNNEPA